MSRHAAGCWKMKWIDLLSGRLNYMAFIFILFGTSDHSLLAQVQSWTTTSDKTSLLQAAVVTHTQPDSTSVMIRIDTTQTYQTLEGFGFTLTGGSARLVMSLPLEKRLPLLNELFGCGDGQLCIPVLRISIGASDLDEEVFTYDDPPSGKEDPSLLHFSLARDTTYLVPLLKMIRQIRPDLKLMATPWTAPLWMKDNRASIGGRLRKEYYAAYAAYFVRYVQAMKKEGIHIHAVTVQNEPEHGGNNPSMVMTSQEQADFVGKYLGPAFRKYVPEIKVIIWDHNCDHPQYPLEVLKDTLAYKYIDGTAFHLYAGSVEALSEVKAAFPEKNIYFTEQWTGAKGVFGDDLQWHIQNVIIGASRNWSKWVLEWNLANDAMFLPHTPGGCTECLGALTIAKDIISRNVSYYLIAHAARFVPAGSVRVFSTDQEELPNVAFTRPDGKKTMILLNKAATPKKVIVDQNGLLYNFLLPEGSVNTLVW
jgi:glucosylceramidase